MEFFEKQAVHLLKGVLEKYGKEYAEQNMHLNKGKTQEAVLATAKGIIDDGVYHRILEKN